MTDRHVFSRWRPHPWHGFEVGPEPPRIVHAYIEITPFDLVKYELDKLSGYLRVDRPQRTSSLPPTLYGFIPRTLCADRVAEHSGSAETADGDPLDICVVSERPIGRSEVLLTAHVVGGIKMIDGGEADDKIIAVLRNDSFWGKAEDLDDLPRNLVDRLRHYFSTYKLIPGTSMQVEIEKVYHRDHAFAVVDAAIRDYRREFPDGAALEAPPGGP